MKGCVENSFENLLATCATPFSGCLNREESQNVRRRSCVVCVWNLFVNVLKTENNSVCARVLLCVCLRDDVRSRTFLSL